MALSKKDLQINITLNEMYNTHSLLQQHIEALVCPFITSEALEVNPEVSSLRATNSTSESWPMNLGLPLVKFRAKRIAQSSFLYSAVGKRQFRTSRRPSCPKIT